MSHILSAGGDALSTYYPSDSSMLIIYVEPASPYGNINLSAHLV